MGLRPATPAGPIAADRPARAEGAACAPSVAGSGALAVGKPPPSSPPATPTPPVAMGPVPRTGAGLAEAPAQAAAPPGTAPPSRPVRCEAGPARPGGSPAAPLRTSPPPAADQRKAAPSRIGGSRVLVIEDEPLVALDISEELRAAGAGQIAIARTVDQALQAVSAGPIDIALLDGNLGGEPVDEVASALERRGIPFCFVSGYGREHLPKPFAHVPVIEKPFRTEALLPVLGRLIGRAEPARDAAGARAG